jgi:hypothetical protein
MNAAANSNSYVVSFFTSFKCQTFFIFYVTQMSHIFHFLCHRILNMTFPSAAKVLFICSKTLIACSTEQIKAFTAMAATERSFADLKERFFELCVFYSVFITPLIHSLNQLSKTIVFANLILPHLLQLNQKVTLLLQTIAKFNNSEFCSPNNFAISPTNAPFFLAFPSLHTPQLSSYTTAHPHRPTPLPSPQRPAFPSMHTSLPSHCPSPLSLPSPSLQLSPVTSRPPSPPTLSISKVPAPDMDNRPPSPNMANEQTAAVVDPWVLAPHFFSPDSFYSCDYSALASDLIEVRWCDDK